MMTQRNRLNLSVNVPFWVFLILLSAVSFMAACSGVNDNSRDNQPVTVPSLPTFSPTYTAVSLASTTENTNLASIFTTVSAGRGHTCALTAAGGVKCWGHNGLGQLGDGTKTNRSKPTDVVGLDSGVVSVSAGFLRTCAVTKEGGVKCWGYNTTGELGDGTTIDRSTPVDVIGLTTGVAAVSVGTFHACAVTTTGGVKCWGENRVGTLGDGTTKDRSMPVDVKGLANGIVDISSGWGRTCVVTATGRIKCWGSNLGGHLGDGTTFNYRTKPVDVIDLDSKVATVSIGNNHTCASTTIGGAKCWGHNSIGELGNGSPNGSLTPIDVSGLSNSATGISAGYEHSCAVTTAGEVKCWGGNHDGELGDGTQMGRNVPTNVVDLAAEAVIVSVGYGHSCAVTKRGGIQCWGLNDGGQLGDGTTTSRLTPVKVAQ
jgi:alpha-tubulin suppressor-like RCC1 family protein